MKRLVLASALVLALVLLPGAIDKKTAREQRYKSVMEQRPASAQSMIRPALPGEKFISIPGEAFQLVAAYAAVDMMPFAGASIALWNEAVAVAPINLPDGAKITLFGARMLDSKQYGYGTIFLRRNNKGEIKGIVKINSSNAIEQREITLSKRPGVYNRFNGYYLQAQAPIGELEFLGIEYVIIGYIMP